MLSDLTFEELIDYILVLEKENDFLKEELRKEQKKVSNKINKDYEDNRDMIVNMFKNIIKESDLVMEKIRKDVLNIMEELERLSEKDYRTFELALALFLRSDREVVKSLSDEELEDLDNTIYDSDFFMSDDLRDYIDSVVE
jgi:hypothetical protein